MDFPLHFSFPPSFLVEWFLPFLSFPLHHVVLQSSFGFVALFSSTLSTLYSDNFSFIFFFVHFLCFPLHHVVCHSREVRLQLLVGHLGTHIVALIPALQIT